MWIAWFYQLQEMQDRHIDTKHIKEKENKQI